MGRMRRALQQRLPVAAGTATLTVFLAAAILLPKTMSEALRNSAFDIELAGDQWLRRPAPSDLKVIVVDIDRASIDALGTWPWPRETMARLVEAVATGRPAAIAIDVLFAEPDDRSAAALARRLGSVTGRAEISTLAEGLPDGDKRLARAIGSVPVALGFVLDPDRDSTLPGAAIASRGSLPFDDLWQAAGAIGPTLPLATAASGLGALSLPGSADGAIRQVPVFVAAGRACCPVWPPRRCASHPVPRAISSKASPRRWWSAADELRCRGMGCSGSCRWQHGVASPARYPRSMSSRDGLTAAGWRARWCCLVVPRRSSAACARHPRTL
jgi:adenylate cyclase